MAIYLIPCPIEEGDLVNIPPKTLQVLRSLNHFVVERSKTTRHYLKLASHPTPLASIEMIEISEQSPEWKKSVENWIRQDISFGIISEAGCPGIADPGAEVVAMAHHFQKKVIPLVGPSSIFLALMASGMNGQSFLFHGYLSNKKNELSIALKKLEKDAFSGTTQIFMEAPYRNGFMLETIISVLRDDTLLCVACDINHTTEEIISQPVKKWKNTDFTSFHKRPCIYLIGKKII